MDMIDGKWIAERLPKEHGIKAKLAAHMGIDAAKLSKVLRGKRELKSLEVSKAKDFFAKLNQGQIERETRKPAIESPSLPSGLAEDAAPFITGGKDPEHTLSALCYAATTPELFKARVDMPGFSIAAGDILVVDLSRGPRFGELGLVAFRDETDQSSTWGVRRWLGSSFISGDARATLDAIDPDGIRMQARGVIVAIARSLAPEPEAAA